MIDSFKRIGEAISKDFDRLYDIERKKAVLDCLTIPIKENYSITKGQSKPVCEIIIDFDTENNKINFKIGEQLRKENRSKYFGFIAGSNTSGKKTYFTTNRIHYHLQDTIPDTVECIDKDIIAYDYDFSEFKRFLITIRDKFYVKTGKKYNLNTNLYVDSIEDEVDYLSKKLGINKKEFGDNFKIFTLQFDGKSILDTQYAQAYISMRYYCAVERFFKYQTKKGLKERKRSHLSGQISQITKNVDIPLKFYITDQAKPVMFENCNINNSYKSLCLNQKEYENVLIGCNFILENLKESFNGLWFLLIPKSESFFKDINENTQYLKECIRKIEAKGFQQDYSKLQVIANKWNFYFDMMFYEKGKSDFNIFRIISDISTIRLKDINMGMTNINLSEYHRAWSIKSNFSLNTIWNNLYSQIIKDAGKDKQKIYRSDFLDYLDIIYSNRSIPERKFVSDSLKNIRKGYFENKKNKDGNNNFYYLIWNSFESLLFMKNLKIIGGGNIESNKEQPLVELRSEKINEFFHNYPEVFGINVKNGREKQGLILIGYLINQIVYAQKGKSSNFLDKINYDGIKKEKIQAFINEVIEFLKIYNTKEKPLLEYNKNNISVMQECLISIGQTSLKKEEITYYILLGNFLGSQIGIHSSKSKDGGKENGDKE